MSGRVGDLSPKQAEKLKLFRERVSDLLTEDHDDHYVLRWLRARSFDLDKSEKMLRDHIAFCKEWNIEYIVSEWEAPEVLERHMIGGLFGEDKEGRPVYYEAYGTVDCKGIIYSSIKADFVRYKLRICEAIYRRFEEQTKKHGRRIDNLTMILDLDQVGLSHLWMPFLNVYFDVLSKFEANYPETLHQCFIINAPSMVSVGYNLFKPFLSADTRTKVRFFGGNYKSKLLEVISADQLPQHYGGTAIDNGDPKCSEKIRYGGKVPKSYYLKELQLSGSSNLKKETVAYGAKLQIPLEVTIPLSALRWEFHTEKDDIGFGVYRKPSGSSTELVEILPSARFSSQLVPESGVVECPEVGTYVVIFDNSFSWVKSKKLCYAVDILPPESSTGTATNSTE
ncbi:SEC14-like protein 2 [Patiria miniata]|uniref:SEC14-like protein 2 n=1 Tax=Patiria miniata TaxID=46514 RepID=A0A913ZX46_PATMI|nr:SEC14-like protein 2 [Patiria miniata]